MDSTRNNDSVAAKYAKTSTWIAFCAKNDDVDRRNTTPGDSRERSRSKMTTLIDEIRRKIRKWIWKCVKNQKKARARPTSEKPKKKEDKEKRWWDAHDGFPRVRRQMVKEVHTMAIATFGKIRQACAKRGAGLRRRTMALCAKRPKMQFLKDTKIKKH